VVYANQKALEIIKDGS